MIVKKTFEENPRHERNAFKKDKYNTVVIVFSVLVHFFFGIFFLHFTCLVVTFWVCVYEEIPPQTN